MFGSTTPFAFRRAGHGRVVRIPRTSVACPEVFASPFKCKDPCSRKAMHVDQISMQLGYPLDGDRSDGNCFTYRNSFPRQILFEIRLHTVRSNVSEMINAGVLRVIEQCDGDRDLRGGKATLLGLMSTVAAVFDDLAAERVHTTDMPGMLSNWRGTGRDLIISYFAEEEMECIGSAIKRVTITRKYYPLNSCSYSPIV